MKHNSTEQSEALCPPDDGQELRAEYGWDARGFYSADTFNENVPPSADPSYLRATSASVYQVTDPTSHALMGNCNRLSSAIR
jgi:hypothetical protein